LVLTSPRFAKTGRKGGPPEVVGAGSEKPHICQTRANVGHPRVQVKSTMFNRKGCYECLCFWSRVSKTRQSKQYSKADIDLVAAYVVPEDLWFLIPVSELQTTTLYLPPRARASSSKYGRFLEAWDLLGVKSQGLTIHACVERTS
jgi:hypothetical protein